MESRYALRELEGAIGYDCRRLEDGRTAMFRHTVFHKRMKRDFFERKDAFSVINSSLLSASGISSHQMVDVRSASKTVLEIRDELIKIAFPYIKNDKSGNDIVNNQDELNKYFDELEEIIEKEKAADESKKNNNENTPLGGGEVGVEGVK